MNGEVDDEFRSLLNLSASKSRSGSRSQIAVWVDTAFNGGLMFPRSLIATLGLTRESSTEAMLADGSVVELETFACFFDWFGEVYETQVIASDSEYPLLGTMLLEERKLVVDYRAKTVELG